MTTGRLALLGLIFFLSGAGALIAETVWLRWMREILGATAPAASATLLAFFAGNALGAIWAARRAPHWHRPLRSYAAIEAAVVLAVLAVPVLLYAGESLLATFYDSLRTAPAALATVRFGVALLATLPAATLYGATFPALGEAALGTGPRLGRNGSIFYAVNLLGAALGAALGAFWLPEALGVSGTYAVAIGLPAIAALGAFILARSETEAEPRGDDTGEQDAPPGQAGPRAIAALSGFGTLCAQVLAVQALGQVLNQSVYAFGTVLVIVLISLAASAAAASWFLRRGGDPEFGIGWATLAAALGLMAFPGLFWHWTDGLAFSGSGEPWPSYLFTCFGVAAASVGPALFACGLLFPLSIAWAGQRAPEAPAGAVLGNLLAANTLGAMAGAIAAPYLLLPALGTWSAFLGVAAAYGIAAVVIRGGSPGLRAARAAVLVGVGASVLWIESPLGLPLVNVAAGEAVVEELATASGIVAVVEREDGLLIRTDNHYSLGGTAEIVHQERQGHIPLLLHPRARSVVHAGSASGISAGALLAHPVERIRLVEIVPEVAKAGAKHFAHANRGVHGDPRVEVILDDAHNYLAKTRERFDVVIADLFVPWRSGTGALFTREHFQNVRDHLEPGGVFCQWLPLYQLGAEEFHVLLATYLDVFPTAALFRGDFYGRFPIVALVGWNGEPATPAEVDAAVARLAESGETDRWVTDRAGFWSLYAGALGPLAGSLAEAPRNRVDRPTLEYLAARHHQGGSVGLARPYVGLAWQRFTDGVRTASLMGDPLYPGLDLEAKRAHAGGAALQMAGALWVEGRSGEASRAAAVAASLLPPRLLSEAEADPTAAEIWPNP